jgi:hypothetical protein
MVTHLQRWRKKMGEHMTWNDVADGIGRMTDQPPDSDLYLRPAVKILGEKFVEEMRAHRFPIPRVRAGDDGHKLIFEWSKNLRLVITATAADFTIADDE